jgi:hypothetical protein
LVSVVLESLIAQAVSYIMLKLGFDLLYEQTRVQYTVLVHTGMFEAPGFVSGILLQ